MPVQSVLAGSGECRTKFIELVIFCFCLIKTFTIISCFPVDFLGESVPEEYREKSNYVRF